VRFSSIVPAFSVLLLARSPLLFFSSVFPFFFHLNLEHNGRMHHHTLVAPMVVRPRSVSVAPLAPATTVVVPPSFSSLHFLLVLSPETLDLDLGGLGSAALPLCFL
jgi:hypothetical protein